MQDTLYYLPAEAHALGWQPEGLAQRLYAHASAASTSQPTAKAEASSITGLNRDPIHKEDLAKGEAGPQQAHPRPDVSSQHMGTQPERTAERDSNGICADEGSRLFVLPAPFTSRPRVGARIFVQSHFPGIAGALASEMLSWQQDTRARCPTAQFLAFHQIHQPIGAVTHCPGCL